LWGNFFRIFINSKNNFEEDKSQIPVTYSLAMQGQDRNGGSGGVLGMGIRGIVATRQVFYVGREGRKVLNLMDRNWANLRIYIIKGDV